MDIFCRTLTDILYVIEILAVCGLYLQRKTKKDKYKNIKVILLSILASLLIYQVKDSVIVLFIQVVFIEVIVIIYYSEDIKKMIIGTLWVLIIVEMINMLSTLMIDTIGSVVNYHNVLLQNLIAVLLSLCIIFIVGICLKKFRGNGISTIQTRYWLIFTGVLIADLMMLTLMASVTLEEMAYRNKILYIISYSAAVFGVFVQLGAVVLLLVSRDMHKEKEQIIKQCLEEQIKYYEYLKNKEKETKKFRHDIMGHLYFLDRLKKEGKNQEFEVYLHDIIGKVEHLGNSVDIGNDIVNAILSKAMAEANERKIQMKVSGYFPTECHISAYHLCTIFFNLLNNAMEAADKAKRKEIWVECQHNSKDMIIEIGNYFCKENGVNKDNLQTTKEDKEYHGWGIKNVEDSVEACRGVMDIDIKEDRFIVSVVLDYKKNGEDK